MVVKQYPYTLEMLVQTGGGYDEAGNPIPSSEGWETVCNCRDEAGNGKKVTLSDNLVHEYSFLVQCPKGTPSIQKGTTIRVKEGDEVRCQGEVIYSRKDQLHTRLWV